MALRHNHYEAAFEAHLRRRRLAYVAVDEQRRSLLGGGNLKNLDFIVNTPDCGNWLIDVKGRKFARGAAWKNWCTGDDLRGLAAWEDVFGCGFRSLLVFVYDVAGDVAPLPEEQLFLFRGRRYAFVAASAADYAGGVRRISPRWDTWAVPTAEFRRLAAPLDYFLGVGISADQAVERNEPVIAG